MVIDPTGNRTDAYYFHITPNSIRQDGLIESREYLDEWKGIWNARASINENPYSVFNQRASIIDNQYFVFDQRASISDNQNFDKRVSINDNQYST